MTVVHILLLFVGVLFACGFLAYIWPDPTRGLYAAIFASAVLFTPALPILGTKVTACEYLIVMTWAAVLAKWPGRPGAVPPMLPIQRHAVGWGAVLMLVCGLAMGVSLVRERVAGPHSVVETFSYLYGFILFLTTVHLATSWRSWINCCYAWTGGAALACSVGLFSLATGGPAWTRDEFTGRLSATFRLSTQLSSYCLPILAFVLVAAGWKSTRPRMSLFLFGVAGAIMANVIGTGSRIAFGMLCFMLVAVAWLAFQGSNRSLFRDSLFRWMGVGLVVGFGWFVLSVVTQEDLSYQRGTTSAAERPIRMWAQSIQDPGSELLDGQRSDQVQTVLDNVYKRPLFGTGPGNFGATFHMNVPHNTYACVLGEEGILGLLSFLAFLAASAYCGWYGIKRSRHGAQYLTVLSMLIGFTTLLIYGMAMFGLRQRPLWIMCGLLVALPRVLYSDHLIATRAAARRRTLPEAVPMTVGEK